METKTFFAQNSQGTILTAADVTVYDAGTLQLATIYDVYGNEVVNPFPVSGGRIMITAPNGAYDIVVQESGGTAVRTIEGVLFFDPSAVETALAEHGHEIGEVGGLQEALNGKAATDHTHSISDVSNLQATLDGKATKTGTETLSNKTLTSPVINTSVTGTALASQAEAEVGTVDNKLMTPERVAQAIAAQAGSGFSSEYKSPEQTLVNGGLITLAHGLGKEPKLIRLTGVCISAEAGFSVGDKIDLTSTIMRAIGGSIPSGLVVWFDNTNISIRNGNSFALTYIINKTNGTEEVITRSNFNLVVEAWA